jgi:mono/diheme cytochrome c family protein
MVLFACFTSGLGMLLLLNRLPLLRHPMLRAKSMPAITRDKFALAVESRGEALDVDAVERLLRNAGAQSVEVVEDLPAPAPLSPRFLMRSVLVIALCCIFAGALTYWGVKLFPASIPMVHMLNQPRLDPQQASDFFKDGFGMRLPVAGTVARGHMPSHLDSPEAAAGLVNPLPRTEAVLLAGKRGFNTFCSVCHGILGNGQTSLTSAYGAKPANLISGQIQALEDGRIYYTIAKGKNAMPSYAADLTEDERWSVVHYVRVLQRAQNAKDTDFSKEPSK